MFELGTEEQAAHRALGVYAADRCDWLIAVGERSRDTVESAREAGHTQACWVAETDQAADILRHSLEPGDTLLVKASHAMHLETVVERLTAS
jgi:UDP-N-acetylmuramoyl-tripeptide--D-alanyl-D-alanine ligase